MKKVKEETIRPKKIFDEYLRLVEIDIKNYFNNCIYYNINCPAYEKDGKFAFYKKGFNYKICSYCRTLYVSPRPEKKAFNSYYSDSASTRYWSTTFYKKTKESRRENIMIPRVKFVLNKIREFSPNIKWIADIGAGYGVFLEEMSKRVDKNISMIAVEPSNALNSHMLVIAVKDKKLHLPKTK